jgi:hypothetical protein
LKNRLSTLAFLQISANCPFSLETNAMILPKRLQFELKSLKMLLKFLVKKLQSSVPERAEVAEIWRRFWQQPEIRLSSRTRGSRRRSWATPCSADGRECDRPWGPIHRDFVNSIIKQPGPSKLDFDAKNFRF